MPVPVTTSTGNGTVKIRFKRFQILLVLEQMGNKEFCWEDGNNFGVGQWQILAFQLSIGSTLKANPCPEWTLGRSAQSGFPTNTTPNLNKGSLTQFCCYSCNNDKSVSFTTPSHFFLVLLRSPFSLRLHVSQKLACGTWFASYISLQVSFSVDNEEPEAKDDARCSDFECCRWENKLTHICTRINRGRWCLPPLTYSENSHGCADLTHNSWSEKNLPSFPIWPWPTTRRNRKHEFTSWTRKLKAFFPLTNPHNKLTVFCEYFQHVRPHLSHVQTNTPEGPTGYFASGVVWTKKSG